MKKTILLLAIAAATSISALAQTAEPAQRQMPRLPQGVGPVMQASMQTSQLPDAAQNFLTKYFPGVAVLKAKNDFKDRRYEVDLADGAEVSFDYNGNWIEVEAPDGAKLPSSTLTALMPESVVEETLTGNALVDGGALQYVEEVVSYPDFYVVQLRTADGTKTRASVSRTDGTVNLLKQKASKSQRQKAYRSDKAKKMKQGRRNDGKVAYGRAVQARFDHNPRFY